MIGVGGYNSMLTDFYTNEVAGRPKAKEAGGLPGRQKMKGGPAIDRRMDTYEPSKATKADPLSGLSKTSSVGQANRISEANEGNLSQKAKDYLKNLREANDDFDFYVANGDDETNSVFGSSGKEYAVAFSNEELEKMADDEEYAQKMLDGIGMAVDMADRISEDLNLGEKGISFNRIDVTLNDDGSMSIVAELQKSADRQREQIEAAREQRIEERKEAAKEKKAAEEEKSADEKKEADRADVGPGNHKMRRFEEAYGRMGRLKGRPGAEDGSEGFGKRLDAYGGHEVLRTQLSADSEEDLFDQVAHVDWNKVAGDQAKQVEVPRFESTI